MRRAPRRSPSARRDAVEGTVLGQSAQVQAMVSIDFAPLQPQDEDHRAWIAHADEALHAAKFKGGNSVLRFRSLKPGRISA
jgi:GGDEF domain-containing protein